MTPISSCIIMLRMGLKYLLADGTSESREGVGLDLLFLLVMAR
jgi:hypothetical protein